MLAAATPTPKPESKDFNIRVEAYPDTTSQKDFELLINEAYINSNS
jgi:hypothetical protein